MNGSESQPKRPQAEAIRSLEEVTNDLHSIRLHMGIQDVPQEAPKLVGFPNI